ncbi:hypothetical protein ACHAWF_018905 [Thalassiosira exigua]
MDNGCTATSIDVGTPALRQGWRGFHFHVHNFADLPAIVDRPIYPPIAFHLFGRNWEFKIFPGGQRGAQDGCVVTTWRLVKGNGLEANYKCSSKPVSDLGRNVRSFRFDSEGETTKHFQLGKRAAIVGNPEKYLRDGTLTISLYVRQAGERMPSLHYVPRNPCGGAILKMMDDESSADVVFQLSGKRKMGEMTKIWCHRFILEACAPGLAELSKKYAKLTPVPIANVRPEVFRALVHYLYGATMPRKLVEARPKEIIVAAGRFGVSNLKVEAEAAYTEFTTISVDNVLENFLFADEKKCALLKEKVMDFLVENGKEVLSKISFKDAPASSTLFHDFMTAVASMGKKEDKYYDGDDPTKFKTMSVDTLRRKLDGRGLDIDGTHEMMVTALEQSYADGGKKRSRDENSCPNKSPPKRQLSTEALAPPPPPPTPPPNRVKRAAL